MFSIDLFNELGEPDELADIHLRAILPSRLRIGQPFSPFAHVNWASRTVRGDKKPIKLCLGYAMSWSEPEERDERYQKKTIRFFHTEL